MIFVSSGPYLAHAAAVKRDDNGTLLSNDCLRAHNINTPPAGQYVGYIHLEW